MLNELGLGLTFEARDLAAGVMGRVAHGMLDVVGASSEAGLAIKSAFKEFGIGLAMFGAGATGLAMLRQPIEDARDFGKAIALVATEADLAIFPQERMRDIALKLTDQFGKMPVDEAASMYKAVALGANDAAKATAFMTAANQLATAGNADLALVTDALGGSINSYGMRMDQASVVSDALFTAMKFGDTTVGAIAGSLGRVNAAAHDAGLSIQETLGAISVMTNKGVDASEAVSGLHEALANIRHPTAAAAAEAAKLGIHFTAAELRGKGLQGFLKEIRTSANFTADSFGHLFESVRGSTAIAQIATDMGAFNDVMGKMRSSAGATAAGFNIMANTSAFQESKLASLKKTASILVGEALEPLAVAALKVESAIVGAFNSMPKPLRDFAVQLFAGASAALALVGGAIALKGAFGLLSAGASALGVTFGGILATAAPVVAVLGVAALAVYGFREAINQNVGGLGDFFHDTVGKASLALRALGQAFSQGGFSGDVLKELDAGNQGVENFVIKLYTGVERIKHFFSEMVDGFGDALGRAGPTFDGLKNALVGVGEAFGLTGVKDGPDAAKAKWEAAGEAGHSMGVKIEHLVEVVTTFATKLLDLVPPAMEVVDSVGSLVNKFGGLEGAANLLEIALVALAANKVAGVAVTLAGIGVSAGKAAIEIGTMTARAVAMGAVSWASIGSAISAAFTEIAASATAAMGPVGAVTFSLTALYMAYTRYAELDQKSHGHGLKYAWLNMKNNVGITSDAEHDQQVRDLINPDDDGMMRRWHELHDRAAPGVDMSSQPDNLASPAWSRSKDVSARPPMSEEEAALAASGAPGPYNPPGYEPAPAFYPPQPNETSTALASAPPPTVTLDMSGVEAAIADLKNAKGGDLNATMVVDGEVLGRVALKGARAAQGAAHLPLPIASD